MDHIVEFEEEITRKLSHQITDLEDVRLAMAALDAVRQQQIEIDMSLGPIEVSLGPIEVSLGPIEVSLGAY